ncbi:MAG: hypothetical protein ACD_50C00148G0004 [uncultured bacterium]|nr:MAG: hypothetical protein ACD_50C00148G0004 [uncultured bacterium]
MAYAAPTIFFAVLKILLHLEDTLQSLVIYRQIKSFGRGLCQLPGRELSQDLMKA